MQHIPPSFNLYTGNSNNNFIPDNNSNRGKINNGQQQQQQHYQLQQSPQHQLQITQQLQQTPQQQIHQNEYGRGFHINPGVVNSGLIFGNTSMYQTIDGAGHSMVDMGAMQGLQGNFGNGLTVYQTHYNMQGAGYEEISNMEPVIDRSKEWKIKDVWAYNMWEELKTIRGLVKRYRYIAMDTEFPGVVAKPIGEFQTGGDYLYQLMKCNVDLLRLIQLGITFFDEEGNLPDGPYTTWQFNFKFNLYEDMYAQESIDLLANSSIQFAKHEEDGIDPFEFASLLIPSGLVLVDDVKWLTFHGSFDFGYLVKILTSLKLPDSENEFFEIFSLYFPVVYDVKYMMQSCKHLKGGLQDIAHQMELKRIGPQHQAGSDSLLTGMAFFKIRSLYFDGVIDDKFKNQLYGLRDSVNLSCGNAVRYVDCADIP